jgi:hypothetical protein
MNSIRRIFLEPLDKRFRITADQIRPAAGRKDKKFLHGSFNLADSSYFLSLEPSIACGNGKLPQRAQRGVAATKKPLATEGTEITEPQIESSIIPLPRPRGRGKGEGAFPEKKINKI